MSVPRFAPIAAVVMAVISWSLGPIFVSSMTISLSATVLLRQLIWLPVLFSLAYLSGDGLTRHHFAVSWKPGVFFALSIALGYGSFRETSVANATLIGSLTPAVLLFMAPRLLGEKVTLQRVAYSVVSFVGVVAVVAGAESGSGAGQQGLLGDAMALGNMLIWTVYFIGAKRARDGGVPSWSFLTGICLVSVLLAIPWALISRDDLFDVSRRDWLLLVLTMIFPGTMGHYLMTWAQRYLDTTVSSLITLGGPVISTSLAVLFLSQSVSLLQVLGGVVVLVGLGGVIFSAGTKRGS